MLDYEGKKSNCLHILCVFVILIMVNFSLENYRYYFVVPAVLLLWFFFLLENEFKVDLDITKNFFYFSIIIIVLGVPSVFEIFPHKENFNYDYFNYSLGLIFKIFCIYSVIVCLNGSYKRLDIVLKYVLVINVSFFFIQFFIVYSTSIYLDPLLYFIGERQRYLSNFSLPIIGAIYRPTGFYEEPSTYSSIIMVLLAAKLYIEPKINRLVLLSLLSIIFSFSVASMVYGFAFGLYLLLRSNGSYVKYIIFLLLPIVVAILGFLAVSRLNAIDGGTDIRNNLLTHVFEQSFLEIIFGNGMLGVVSSLADFMNSGNLWKANVAALNDNGLWLFIIIKTGVLGLLTITYFVFKKSKNNMNKILFLVVLLTKVSLFYFVFIMYLGLYFIGIRKENDS